MSNKPSEFISQTLKNESGIALLMVIGVIAVLTFLLADFTFETKLNKIKIYNQQDKIQARLNAESGLNFALAKLRMYQEGRNKIEKDENLKTAFPSSQLEAIIIQPFMYPIPAPSKINIIQRTALEEFNKKTIFRGEVSVTFTKIAGFLNPNGLRIKLEKATPGGSPPNSSPDEDETNPQSGGNDQDDGDSSSKASKEKPDIIIEKKLIETLTRLIKEKSDTDEEFHSRYSNLDPTYLIKELKYYVNDEDKFQDAQKQEVEAKFSQKNMTPKHAPMTSIDELYLLPSWEDAIVTLIKDRLSVHEVSVISVNELTTEDLKIIFPDINNIQSEEFFEHRDGNIDKKIKGVKFKSAEDFKKVVVSELNIVSDSAYNDRINLLKQAGLVIGTSGKIYKVNSRGVMNNAVYNLTAYIDLPIKEIPQKKKGEQPPKTPGPSDSGLDPDDQGSDGGSGGSSSDKKEEKAPPTELLLPRIIELRLE